MKFKTILFLLLSFSLVMACQCKRYARHSNASDPFFREREGYLFDFCKNEEAIMGFSYLPKHYVNEYKLPNDSIVSGYTASISFNNMQKDSTQHIRVGKGSEFWAGKCKFRVIKVEPRKLWNSTKTNLIAPHVLFQLLELPKFCPCQNKKLRKFDLEQNK